MKKSDIQIKFKIEDVDAFLEKIKENKYILIGGAFEKTTRYDYEDERLLKNGIFIRTKNGFSDTVTIKEKVRLNKIFIQKNWINKELLNGKI